METVLKISAVALIGALLALVLKKHAPENALLVTVACGVVLLLFVLDIVGEFVRYWDKLAARVPYAGEIAGPLLKAAGISVVAHLSAELCRDCGQSALGAKVELAGTVACIVVMIPLADMVFDLIGAML